VIEWLEANLLAHTVPHLGAVGNYMFTAVDECMQFATRAAA
jgi:hypothetical protein